MRRLLLVSSGGGEPAGPPPPDPSLTAERHVTQLTGLSQNVYTAPADRTWRTEYRAAEDFTTLTLAYGATGQGALTAPATGSFTIETPSGSLLPVTWEGSPSLSLDEGQVIESDPVDVTIGEGEVFWIRMLQPNGARWTVSVTARPTSHMLGDHRIGAWVPADQPSGAYPESPTPLAVIGLTRESVVCPAMIGDSIAAMGIGGQGWWRTALGLRPGLSYGRNANRFTNLDGREGDTLRAATHVVVQYGANDLGSSPAVATLWATAVNCYAYVDSLHPGIPTWQTTCTPLVSTSDECATLAGQALTSSTRIAWNAFLRDGAPCHPDTKAALSVGATGLRAGQDGHPLQGIVDIAAAVEQGGLAGTGKWRVDLGPLGGDGVHPSSLGESIMAGPTSEWMATLTT